LSVYGLGSALNDFLFESVDSIFFRRLSMLAEPPYTINPLVCNEREKVKGREKPNSFFKFEYAM